MDKLAAVSWPVPERAMAAGDPGKLPLIERVRVVVPKLVGAKVTLKVQLVPGLMGKGQLLVAVKGEP